jgi:N-methylhydantoinase A
VVGEIREYERASTTVANAYVSPLADRYLHRLEERWQLPGDRSRFFMMASNGGFISVNRARQYPVKLVASGAAAGVIAAKFIGQVAGLDNIIAFDMGGTTAKASVGKGNRLQVAYETEVARAERFKRGSGLPLRVPVVDLIEVGAGGGSIAYRDSGGLLKVGPRSAEANPGPACYGQGGEEPTVTDADLLLGYLNPTYFLGGEMPLLPERSREAITSRLAELLGISTEDAAWGIREVVNENMAMALRVHVAERGEDPRNFALVATGGAGPTHAFDIARKLAIDTVVYPFGAGVASCLGLLVAPPMVEIGRSSPVRLRKIDWNRFFSLYRVMEKEALDGLTEVGIDMTHGEVIRQADMRYVGQGHEVTVDLLSLSEDSPDVSTLHDAFEQTFIKHYGKAIDGVPVEVISLRVIAKAPAPSLSLAHVSELTLKEPFKGDRKVYLGPQEGWTNTPVFDRYAIPPDWSTVGPALVEERESTAWIGPGGEVRVDEAKNLIVSVPLPPTGEDEVIGNGSNTQDENIKGKEK